MKLNTSQVCDLTMGSMVRDTLKSCKPYHSYCQYIDGDDKPHYPVPAIIYDVMIDCDHPPILFEVQERMSYGWRGFISKPWG